MVAQRGKEMSAVRKRVQLRPDERELLVRAAGVTVSCPPKQRCDSSAGGVRKLTCINISKNYNFSEYSWIVAKPPEWKARGKPPWFPCEDS